MLAGAVLALAAVWTTGMRTVVVDTASGPAAERVVIVAPRSDVVVSASSDGEVHAMVQGSYVGDPPRVEVTSSHAVSAVTGGCPVGGVFTFCRATVTVRMPFDADIDVRGQNGFVSVRTITGAVRVRTTNGSIVVRAPVGDLRLTTGNGAIEVSGATSERATLDTVNGDLRARFSAPPAVVEVTGFNGSVDLRLPEQPSGYRLDLVTVTGDTTATGVRDDPTAARSITVHTVNGDIRVRAG